MAVVPAALDTLFHGYTTLCHNTRIQQKALQDHPPPHLDQPPHMVQFKRMSKQHPPQTISLATCTLHTRLIIRIQPTGQISWLQYPWH